LDIYSEDNSSDAFLLKKGVNATCLTPDCFKIWYKGAWATSTDWRRVSIRLEFIIMSTLKLGTYNTGGGIRKRIDTILEAILKEGIGDRPVSGHGAEDGRRGEGSHKKIGLLEGRGLSILYQIKKIITNENKEKKKRKKRSASSQVEIIMSRSKNSLPSRVGNKSQNNEGGGYSRGFHQKSERNL